MNRLELVTECLRAALNTLAAFDPDWLREVADPEWYDRYGHRMENYRFPKSDQGKQIYADQVGKDGQTLLALVAREDVPQGSQHLAEVLTLERCWQRQFIERDGAVRFRLRCELVKKGAMHVESPYDPEARYSTKRGREWHGYKVHVSETCDDGLPHLITQVATTTAEVQDVPLGQHIQTDLFRRDLQRTEYWVDVGYNAAERIVRAKEQHGSEIIGPVWPNTSHTGSVYFVRESALSRFPHSMPGTRFSPAHFVRISRCFQHLSIGVRIRHIEQPVPLCCETSRSTGTDNRPSAPRAKRVSAGRQRSVNLGSPSSSPRFRRKRAYSVQSEDSA